MPSLPIAELEGATPAAVVALSRAGITSIDDLLRAEQDQVAYLVESFDLAERMCRAARKHVGARADPKRPGPEQRVKSNETDAPLLACAMALALRDAKPGGDEWRFSSVRLMATRLVIDDGGSETEACAATLAEQCLGGQTADRREIEQVCGEGVANLADEASMLLSVPVSPSGRAGAAYTRAVDEATDRARRVAAAVAFSAVVWAIERAEAGEDPWSAFAQGRDFALWHFHIVADALARHDTALSRALAERVGRLDRL